MVRLRARQLLLVTGTAMILFAGYLWYALFSEAGYQRPEHLSPIDKGQEHRVFVYGTLRLGLIRQLVIGEHGRPDEATLPGYRREGLTLHPDPDSVVTGELLTVSPEQLQQLDRYERLGVRYRRIRAPLARGNTAWVYLR